MLKLDSLFHVLLTVRDLWLDAHCLNSLSKICQQQTSALVEARNTVLGNPESLRHTKLRELARFAQLTQSPSSAMSSVVRSSTFLRRAALSFAIISFTFKGTVMSAFTAWQDAREGNHPLFRSAGDKTVFH